MILVDSSVWISHLRRPLPPLSRQLKKGAVLTHPFILAELALANLRYADELLIPLACLPQAVIATDEQLLAFIRSHGLRALGLGYAETCLLAAASLTPDATLWTQETHMRVVAEYLGLAMPRDAIGKRRNRLS